MIGTVGKVLFFGVSAAAILSFAAATRSAADAPVAAAKSVADGVYSNPQKRRGMSTYMKECSSCHGESLRGGESSPALIGPDFRMRWNGRTLSELFDKMRLMPPNDPGKATPEQVVDIIAAVLGANGFPAGPEELLASPERLQAVHIVDTEE